MSQTWIDRGKESFGRLDLAEAAARFEKAVLADPESVEARLCYGVVRLLLYQNGISAAEPRFNDDDAERQWSDADNKAEIERVRVMMAEQNATNGKRAEEALRRALELDPENKLAMEYLAALYYRWAHPDTELGGNRRRSRLDDAKRLYKEIFYIDPEHNFANYVCGVIDWEKAFNVLRASGRYPRPLPNEEARRALHAKVEPLLDEAARNLLRALEIDPVNWWPMGYLISVRTLQAYVAATNDESTRASTEAADWTLKLNQILGLEETGQPQPPGETASITFLRVSESSQPTVPAFPPDPKMMIPMGIPPPPSKPM